MMARSCWMSPLINKYTCTMGLLAAAGIGCALLASHPAVADAKNQPTKEMRLGIFRDVPTQVPGEVLVHLAPGADAQALAKQFHLSVKQALRFAPHTYLFQGVQGSPDDAASFISQVPGVLAATP